MIAFVCYGCAIEAGGVCNHHAEWHVSECDVCGDQTAVTEPSEFGYPKFDTGADDGD